MLTLGSMSGIWFRGRGEAVVGEGGLLRWTGEEKGILDSRKREEHC